MNRRDMLVATRATAVAASMRGANAAEFQPAMRYPDAAGEIADPSFEKNRLGLTAVERVATGLRWAEGPAWFGAFRTLMFSDVSNNRLMRWNEETGELGVFRKPSNHSNGNTRDRQGRLVTCEHLTLRATRTGHDGTITVLIDGFEGKGLNSPNDIVCKSDGSGIARSYGACMTMGTASTMTAIAEAVGMSLSGASSVPAADAGHIRLAAACGRRIIGMVWEDLTPSRIQTHQAFENAVAVAMAMGCSTNAIIHLIAMVRRAGQDIGLDDFERCGSGWMFSRHIRQANEACDFDFRATGFGAQVPEPAIY